MIPVPQTAAAASKVFLLCYGFPVRSFRSWSFSLCVVVLPAAALFCFVCHISGGARHLLFKLLPRSISFHHFFLFNLFNFFVSLSLSFFSVCQRIRIAISSICMPCLSYPARWPVIALSTLITALQRSISVSWFCDHRACISLININEGSARRLGVLSVDGYLERAV